MTDQERNLSQLFQLLSQQMSRGNAAFLPRQAVGARGQALLLEISERVAAQLALEIGADVSWRSTAPGDNLFRAFGGGCFALKFKVLFEALTVVLPLELVHELSAIIRNETVHGVLQPGDEEATAIAYAAAKVLARLRRAGERPAYLCSAEATSEKAAEELVNNATACGELQLAGECYPVFFVLTRRLVSALELSSRKQPVPAVSLQRLHRARLKIRPVLKIPLSSLSDLGCLCAGRIFSSPAAACRPYVKLNFPSGPALEGSLVRATSAGELAINVNTNGGFK